MGLVDLVLTSDHAVHDGQGMRRLSPDPVEAVCGRVYVAEAKGYLSLQPSDCVVAWLDQAEPGDPGCAWQSYVFVCDKADVARRGWVPAELLWRRFVDAKGRPWLFHDATGDWCWEQFNVVPRSEALQWPGQLLWRRFVDEQGRQWLFQDATGDVFFRLLSREAFGRVF